MRTARIWLAALAVATKADDFLHMPSEAEPGVAISIPIPIPAVEADVNMAMPFPDKMAFDPEAPVLVDAEYFRGAGAKTGPNAAGEHYRHGYASYSHHNAYGYPPRHGGYGYPPPGGHGGYYPNYYSKNAERPLRYWLGEYISENLSGPKVYYLPDHPSSHNRPYRVDPYHY